MLVENKPPEGEVFKDGALTKKDVSSAPAARDDKAGEGSGEPSKDELAIDATVAKAVAFRDNISDKDAAVGATAIQDMLAFFTGDPKIADFKLRYISYLAGYDGADLKGKRWSFAKGCDYRFYIYPETLEEAFQASGDFAMKKTYGTLSNVLSMMPKVEIRSFAQRTLLQSIADGTATAISDIAKAPISAAKAIWNNGFLTAAADEWKTVWNNIKNAWKADPEDSTSIFGKIIGKLTPADFKGGDHAALLNLPFIFYYCLASSVTRCYFSLPLDSRSYENLWGSQSQGWANSKESTLAGKVEAINGISDLGITSILTTAFTRSFGMQFMPTFDASKVNTKTGEGELDLTFVLMNDTEEHAMSNVAFLRVLFPSAMWSNVGIFAISGDLFDVKVKGAMRWLMCTGEFECVPVGAIRLIKRGSKMRVPDAYKVHCTFKSLIPNSLNNYLIGYLTEFKMQGRNSVLGHVYENIKNVFNKQ